MEESNKNSSTTFFRINIMFFYISLAHRCYQLLSAGCICALVCLSSAACFCAGFCDVGLNLQNCYLKPTSATQRESLLSPRQTTHTRHTLYTHIPLQTHRNHTLAFILNGHMSFFHSTHPTLVALSLSISPTHTHTRYNNTSAGGSVTPDPLVWLQ